VCARERDTDRDTGIPRSRVELCACVTFLGPVYYMNQIVGYIII